MVISRTTLELERVLIISSWMAELEDVCLWHLVNIKKKKKKEQESNLGQASLLCLQNFPVPLLWVGAYLLDELVLVYVFR